MEHEQQQRAVPVTAIGKPLKLGSRTKRRPKENEVLIKVLATMRALSVDKILQQPTLTRQ